MRGLLQATPLPLACHCAQERGAQLGERHQGARGGSGGGRQQQRRRRQAQAGVTLHSRIFALTFRLSALSCTCQLTNSVTHLRCTATLPNHRFMQTAATACARDGFPLRPLFRPPSRAARPQARPPATSAASHRAPAAPRPAPGQAGRRNRPSRLQGGRLAARPQSGVQAGRAPGCPGSPRPAGGGAAGGAAGGPCAPPRTARGAPAHSRAHTRCAGALRVPVGRRRWRAAGRRGPAPAWQHKKHTRRGIRVPAARLGAVVHGPEQRVDVGQEGGGRRRRALRPRARVPARDGAGRARRCEGGRLSVCVARGARCPLPAARQAGRRLLPALLLVRATHPPTHPPTHPRSRPHLKSSAVASIQAGRTTPTRRRWKAGPRPAAAARRATASPPAAASAAASSASSATALLAATDMPWPYLRARGASSMQYAGRAETQDVPGGA